MLLKEAATARESTDRLEKFVQQHTKFSKNHCDKLLTKFRLQHKERISKRSRVHLPKCSH